MQVTAQSIWWPRLATFFLALLAAASVAYWGLKLSGSSSASTVLPAQAGAAAPVVDALAVARMLGGGQQAAATPLAAAPSRYVLAGIVTEGKHAGAALISVDGKPARPFRVGAKVEEGLVLQSLAPRAATLGASADAPASMTLELPRKP